MGTLLCLQGPNLNLLGSREPHIYGSDTLQDIEGQLDAAAATLGVRLEHFQSNHEGALIDRIHRAAADGLVGCVVNPGAYGHTSVALRDAFVATALPFVEVHLSNVYGREVFRRTSLLAPVAVGGIVGLGAAGYTLALSGLVQKLGLAREGQAG